MKKKLYKIILIIEIILVGYVTYCSIFNIYKPAETLEPIVIIIGVIVLIFVFIRLKKLLEKFLWSVKVEKYSNLIAGGLCTLFFIGLALFGCSITSIPTFDLNHLDIAARELLTNGKSYTGTYFVAYPYQFPVTMLIYYIYKIGTILNVSDLRIFATIANSLFIAVTAFFTYLSVKKVKNHKLALISLLFFIINPIFYLYSSYYYTDTLCMPFAAIAIYMFIIGLKSEDKKKIVVSLIVSGILLSIGYKIRAVIAILLIGIIIAIFVNNKFTKKSVLNISSIIVGFIAGIILVTLMSQSFTIVQDSDGEFPVTHFIMMALNEDTDGKYSSSDWKYTYSQSTYSEKISANIEMIKTRLKEYNIKGLISFSKLKLSVTWSDGWYYCLGKIQNVENINILYEYFAGNKRIFITYYLQICKAAILLVFLFAIAKELKNESKSTAEKGLFISIFGAFLFYMIWEVKQSYSLTFQVQNYVTRSYTSKRVYIGMSVLIVILEVFAFYPYLRKCKNKINN